MKHATFKKNFRSEKPWKTNYFIWFDYQLKGIKDGRLIALLAPLVLVVAVVKLAGLV